MVDIFQSELVPEQILLTEEEKEKVLSVLNVSLRELPKIKENDPVVKLLKAKKNDVIKIIRNSPTAGKSIYYRVVVK
jgi:DNA-directed RNA polymerase subunit H